MSTKDTYNPRRKVINDNVKFVNPSSRWIDNNYYNDETLLEEWSVNRKVHSMEKERPTNIPLQLKRRPGKVIENICVFYKKQCTYNPQMRIHEGKPVSNKIKHGKLGNIIDEKSHKPTEYIDMGLRHPLQIIKFKRDILTSNLHPTQKPLAFMEYLIKTYTNENDVVLDFTMGSDTTGIACRNLNRKFIGIEKGEKYFNMVKKRILG